jgi:hypothetical protein
VDSERAERHLRLAAEAALRRARTLPCDDGQVRPREIFTECIARLRGVATTLVTVGAVDAGQADMIMDEFQAALGVRHLHPITASPLFMPRPMPAGPPAGPPMTGTPMTGGPATGGPAPSAPLRVLPVSRMLPIRDQDLTGELYVMSLVVTAAQAAVPAVARIRAVSRDGGRGRAALAFPALDTVTATDDRGTPYQTGWHGGGPPGRWAGHLQIRPAPPPDARWLELSAAGQASLRIALTGARPAASLTAEPRPSAPGEQLLADVAQQILAAAADDDGMARQAASNLGDTVTALEAAAALSPLSPTPGQLATVCDRLGIGRHGITARPTGDLPAPWLSVLACYGRRHRSAVRDGVATVGLPLPEMAGARIALGGLHSVDDQSYLHVFGCGLPAAWTSRRSGPEARPAFGWWLRDDAGHWHAAVPGQWTEDIRGEISIMLRVLPPLGQETGSGTLFITLPAGRASVHMPLSWWASP